MSFCSLGNPTSTLQPRFYSVFTRLVPCVLLCTLLCSCVDIPFVEQTPAQPEADPLEALMAAVVRIDTQVPALAGGARRTERSTGSGVIVSSAGHILTNAHVVAPQAEAIVVTLDSLERVRARLVGHDTWTDLALLQIEGVEALGQLPVAHFSDAQPRAGQTVFAAGTPYGFSRTLTRGIISNPKRTFGEGSARGEEASGRFNTWLQTDAAINPGNSGGPLVDAQGHILGISTRSLVGADNLSFAVPAPVAQAVLAELKASGTVTRSYAGFQLAPLQALDDFYGLDRHSGVFLEGVDPHSPAAEAGLQAGDILIALDGAPLDGRYPEQLPALRQQVAAATPGAALAVTYVRQGELAEAALITRRLEAPRSEEDVFEDWGLSVQEVDPALAREHRVDNDEGVLVVGLQDALPAARAGLYPGDVILSLNRTPVAGIADLRAAYQTHDAGSSELLLEVLRDRRIAYVVLQL